MCGLRLFCRCSTCTIQVSARLFWAYRSSTPILCVHQQVRPSTRLCCVSPFAHVRFLCLPYSALDQAGDLMCGAGSERAMIRLSFPELVSVTNGKVGDIAEPGEYCDTSLFHASSIKYASRFHGSSHSSCHFRDLSTGGACC